MELYNQNLKLKTLYAKGGLLFFTIERSTRLYRGTILLSPVKDNRQKRAVYIKEYLKKNVTPDNIGGQNETL